MWAAWRIGQWRGRTAGPSVFGALSDRALPSLLDQIGELVEEVGGVMRAGRSFGVILHAEDRQFFVPHPLHGAVV